MQSAEKPIGSQYWPFHVLLRTLNISRQSLVTIQRLHQSTVSFRLLSDTLYALKTVNSRQCKLSKDVFFSRLLIFTIRDGFCEQQSMLTMIYAWYKLLCELIKEAFVKLYCSLEFLNCRLYSMSTIWCYTFKASVASTVLQPHTAGYVASCCVFFANFDRVETLRKPH